MDAATFIAFAVPLRNRVGHCRIGQLRVSYPQTLEHALRVDGDLGLADVGKLGRVLATQRESGVAE
jgi:hypothetical protein